MNEPRRVVYGVYDVWDYFQEWLFATEESALAWIAAQPDKTLESKEFGPAPRYYVKPLELLP